MSFLTSPRSRLQPARRLATTLIALLGGALFGQTDQTSANDGFDPNVNGVVNVTAVQSDGKILLGGAFTTLLPNNAPDRVDRNYVARVNADGTLDLDFNPNANGQIYALAVQADGKILIGGAFTTLQPNNAAAAVTRNRLARLNRDGTLDTAFNPNLGGGLAPEVYAMLAQSDGKIVIGGAFTTVGGVTRNRIARLNADGSLDTAFDPNANSPVLSLARQSDGKLIVGGSFTEFQPAGTTAPTIRGRLARLNLNGTVDSEFDPRPNNTVSTIAVQVDGAVLIGGNFSTLQPLGADTPTARSRIARLGPDGSLDAFYNPNANAQVVRLVLQPDGRLLIAGHFTTLRPNGGATVSGRTYIARLNPDGTVDPDFQVNSNGAVQALSLQPDGRIVVGGLFTQLRSSTASVAANRNRLARLNSDGSVDIALDPAASGLVLAQAVQADGKTVLVGTFTIMGGLTRNYVARLNADGTVDTAFSPSVNGVVQSVAIQPADGKILLGGAFTNVGGVARAHVARLDADGKLDTTLNLAPNNTITALAVQADGKILLTGPFTSLQPDGLASTPRNHFARVSSAGAVDTAFNPNPDAPASVITVLPDGKILVGGNFTSLAPNAGSSVIRSYSARLNSDGTVDTAYDPRPSGPIFAQVVQADGKIVLGGNFNAFAPKGATTPTLRHYIARFNSDSTLDTTYNPRAGAPVAALALQADGKIVAGGSFNFFRPKDDVANNVIRNRLARINTDGTIDAAYDPNFNGQVIAVTVLSTGKILASGGFVALAPPTQGLVLARNRVVRLNLDGTVDGTFDPTLTTKNGGVVGTLAFQPDGKLIVAGEFTNFAGARSANLARFSAAGDADSSFIPNADGPVATVLVQPVRANVLVQASNFAWFNRDGSLRASFNHANVAQLSGQINAVLVQPNGKIIVAGAFSNKTGLTGDNLARLNLDGSFDTTWKPGVAGTINAIALQADGKLIIGGSFDSVGGLRRYRIARINVGGDVDAGYDPYAGDVVNALVIQSDGKCIIGGAFLTLQPNGATTTTARNYLARLATDGTVDTAYNPNANGIVRVLALQDDGKLLAGGAFTTLQPNATTTAVTRNYFARLLPADGAVDSDYNPGPGGVVYAIALQADGKAIIGGSFGTVQPNTADAFARNNIARLNLDGTLDSNFTPSTNGTVQALTLTPDGSVLLGGAFTVVQGVNADFAVTRNHLALVASDGTLNPGFNPGPLGNVYAVAASADGSIILAGAFTSLEPDGSMIVGGAFANIGGSAIANLARLDGDGNAAPGFTPNPNGPVAALAQQADTKLIVGGNFTNIAGLPRNRLARLNLNGTLDTAYNPNADGAVSALALQSDGKLIVGGSFTNLGGAPRTNLARVNVDGSLDATFNAPANASVTSVLVRPDGKIVVAGTFTTLGGQTRNRLARLNSDGSLDSGFNPNVNGPVSALVATADGKILLGGTFTSVGGAGRANVARLNADGTLDATFNPGTDTSVLALAIPSDGAPVLGGAFNIVAGQTRYRLARLTGNSLVSQRISASADRKAVTWTRTGGGPELSSARFEISTDNITWTALGAATRVGTTANWQLPGLSLSATDTFYVRALGVAPTSKNASSGLVRSAQVFNFTATPVLSGTATVGASMDKAFRYATADGTAAVYSALGLPAGLSIDSATGLITGTPAETGNFAITVTASNAGGNVSTTLALRVGADAASTVSGIRLFNLAARAQVAAGGVAITGFSSGGGAVLIRAIGPGLAPFGVGGVLADPVLNVYNSAGALIATNDNWGGANVSAAAAATGAFPLTASGKDAAILLDLPAGGYTAQVADASGGSGVVLTEIYDAAGATLAPRFSNLSARAPVAPGSPLVGGFVITAAGGGTATQRVLIRGVGPALAKFGIAAALADPVLKVYDSAGALIATNDNWSDREVSTAGNATGAFALDAGSKDAALLLTLAPGSYTFEVTGANGTTGEALADIYAAP